MSSKLSDRSILITGVAGFLGSHLADRFLSDGAHVTGLDNMMCGSKANLSRAFSTGRFTLLEADVIAPYDGACDIIVNMACAASPSRYQADPLHTMKTSVLGAINAADLAVRNSARLVQTSTSEIYGDPAVHPQPETYRGSVNPIGPRACYDEGKRAAETILFDYHRGFGLDIGVCRIFNTYGPRMDPFDGRVVSNFIRQALTGEPLTIFGKGEQTRSFCYVDDMVDGLYHLALASAEVTGPINIGNPAEMTILELAETVSELVDRPVELKFETLPTDDPTRRKPVIDEAEAQLGWAPAVPLRKGLSATIDYFDDIIRTGRIHDYAEAHRIRFGKVAA